MQKIIDFKSWFKMQKNYHPQDCKHCHGSGISTEAVGFDCPHCLGTGKKITITHIEKYQRERDEQLLNRYLAGTVTQ